MEDESTSAKPVRFLYFDDHIGKFKLDPDGIHLLHQIKGPVAVVSVCGPSCQGKSFISNRLLGRSTGFQVGSTYQPCTQGLWIWSVPLKKTALDGTDYSLLLFDSGGTNAYNQTGMYNTRICSLAVLLSSLFIYNQVGAIDEAALDHLAHITEMTKHIHRLASQAKDFAFDLGYFSPVFVWLLRDFYLDLMEDNTKIKPHDYLELALGPITGNVKDNAAINQICESIRAVFPVRECFALVRPLNDETDLRHVDRVPLDKYRPEFLSGLDAFANFVYNRTRPKQVGESLMTGPLLADITESFLDVLNSGSFPTVSCLWQVCRRESVGETDIQCLNAIENMEKRLQEACIAKDAKIEKIAMVIENLVSEYKESVRGQTKWQKLSSFLQKSLRGPFLHHAQKLTDEASLEKNSLMLKCRSMENEIQLLHKRLEASEKSKAEYEKRYEGAIGDFRKVSNEYKSRIVDLEDKFRLLEKRHSGSLEMLDSARQEAAEWERKYEEILTKSGAVNDQASANAVVCRTVVSDAKERAAVERCHLALKEANEWKEKYDIAINETKAAKEKVGEQAKRMEEDIAAAAEQSRVTLQEANKWKEKYDIATKDAKAAEEKAAERAKLMEDDVAAASEQSRLALKEANEWKEKYDIATKEAKAAEEKAAEWAKHMEEDVAAASEQSRVTLKEAQEWKEKYDAAINEAKAAKEKAAEQAKRIEEDVAQSRLASKEANEWREKYEIAISEAKAAREKADEQAKLIEENAEQSCSTLKEANEWKEKYDVAINEANAAKEKAAEQAKHMEKDVAAAAEQARLALEEANEWKRKYKAAREKEGKQTKTMEKEVVASAGQSQLALTEANEWKEKYDIAISEAKAAREKAVEQEKLLEDTLRSRFTIALAEKDEEIKDKVAKLEEAEQRLTYLTSELKTAESKVQNYDLELSALKLQVEEVTRKCESVKASGQSMGTQTQTLVEDGVQLEQNTPEVKNVEGHDSCKLAKEEAKVTNLTEADIMLGMKSRTPSVSLHKHSQILEGEKMDVVGEVGRSAMLEGDAASIISRLEAMIRERDEEIELLKKMCEKSVNGVPFLGSDLNFKRTADKDTNKEHLHLHQQESTLDRSFGYQHQQEATPDRSFGYQHQQEATPDRSFAYAENSGLRSCNVGKRSRLEVPDVSPHIVNEESREETDREKKKPKSSSALAKCTTPDVDSVFQARGEDNESPKVASVDYAKLSVWKLRQELNEHGFGEELQKLSRYPKKKDILALYEKFILEK